MWCAKFTALPIGLRRSDQCNKAGGFMPSPLMNLQGNFLDDIIRVIASSTADHIFVVLPHGSDARLQLVYESFEARIWKDKDGYSYEIVSLGSVLAQGEATTAYTALERTLPLIILLHRSGRAYRAA